MTFQEFKVAVERHFIGAHQFRDLGSDNDYDFCYVALVLARGYLQDVMLVRSRESGGWSAFRQAIDDVRRRVIGVDDPDNALRQLAVILGRPLLYHIETLHPLTIGVSVEDWSHYQASSIP